MKLTFRRVDLKLRRTWRISTGLGGNGTSLYGVVFVEVSDDHGRGGLGEGAPSDRYAESVETIERFLNKVDPERLSLDDLAGSGRYLESVAPGNHAAKCAVK